MPRLPRTDIKATLLRTALKIFAKNGYHATSLSQIAVEAGVTKGTIYWYFKDKSDLFESAIREKVTELDRTLTVSIPSNAPADVQMRQLLQITFGFHADNPELANLFNIVRSGSEIALDIDQDLREYYRTVRQDCRNIVELGIKQGLFPPANSFTLATWILATIDGIAIQWGLDPAQIDILSITAEITEYIIQQLRMGRPTGVTTYAPEGS